MSVQKHKVGRKDIFAYAKTFFILTICFGLIGNYIYNESFERLKSDKIYHDESLNSLFHKNYNNFVLEGGHDYIFYFFIEGPLDTYLHINMIFETMDNISHIYDTGADKTWFQAWGENSNYTKPLYISQNETINISVVLTTETISAGGLHWQMLVYQDLPFWTTKSLPIITFLTIPFLVIWVIAHEQYEKIFSEINKQKGKWVKKTEEVTNVE